MLLGIDHIVVAVAELEAATKSYRELGFTVVRGGKHPTGTHNSLVGLEDGSYIELIAVYEPTAEALRWCRMDEGGQDRGLIDFCMQTSDLAGDAGRLRRLGIGMTEPAASSRQRPDGYVVRWRLSTCEDANRGVVPFLIEDETPREERVPRETKHANSVTGIGTLTIAVEDVARARGVYAEMLGAGGEGVEREDIGGRGVRFVVGKHALEFLAPVKAGGILDAWMRERGVGPFEATFVGGDGKKRLLDLGKSLGARLVVGMAER